MSVGITTTPPADSTCAACRRTASCVAGVTLNGVTMRNQPFSDACSVASALTTFSAIFFL